MYYPEEWSICHFFCALAPLVFIHLGGKCMLYIEVFHPQCNRKSIIRLHDVFKTYLPPQKIYLLVTSSQYSSNNIYYIWLSTYIYCNSSIHSTSSIYCAGHCQKQYFAKLYESVFIYLKVNTIFFKLYFLAYIYYMYTW